MGQMKMYDEDEIHNLIDNAVWCDVYRNLLKKCHDKLYPNYISTDPVSGYQYDYEILWKMFFEIKEQRKPWWRKIF